MIDVLILYFFMFVFGFFGWIVKMFVLLFVLRFLNDILLIIFVILLFGNCFIMLVMWVIFGDVYLLIW